MMGPIAALGAAPTGDRLARIQRSANFRDGAFQNPVATTLTAPGTTWQMLRRQFGGDEQRTPLHPPPIVTLTAADYAVAPASGLRITWLGHSSTLIEIDGARVLIDPVFDMRVSPTQLFGPRRFHAPPLPLAELPALDAVILTHDHYDHLDMAVVRFLARSARHRGTHFVTALGVGAHLERWGVAPSRITELDWGDRAHVGGLAMTATPARHFSGRGLKRNGTLWASWVIAGEGHRVFHSGDSGFFDGAAKIGAEHGPFDVNLVKIGAYAPEWPDIHLTPEDAVRMHGLLGGPLLMPIHWGTFNLAFHAWNEPPERLVVAANEAGVRVAIPRPGERVEPVNPPAVDPWWRES
jgi:L-ascorbate metabolism protein UlaG (beta-lactamase superfamily)